MNEVWIIKAPGGSILTATTSEDKALEIIELEQEVRPGAYSIVHSRIVPNNHAWKPCGHSC